MTHNPTPAEVQDAYDWLSKLAPVLDNPFKPFLETLLAAVARDRLGWREVRWREWSSHKGPARLEYSNVNDAGRHFIKDAAP